MLSNANGKSSCYIISLPHPLSLLFQFNFTNSRALNSRTLRFNIQPQKNQEWLVGWLCRMNSGVRGLRTLFAYHSYSIDPLPLPLPPTADAMLLLR